MIFKLLIKFVNITTHVALSTYFDILHNNKIKITKFPCYNIFPSFFFFFIQFFVCFVGIS